MDKRAEIEELRRKNSQERRKTRIRAAQRQGAFYAFTAVALGGMYWYAQGDLTPTSEYTQRASVVLEQAQKTMLREEVQSAVEPLTEGDLRKLDRQRGLVDALARRHVGFPMTGGAVDDLRVLQELIDNRALAVDQTFELQSLGVVLGDVLAEQFDLEWVIVDDRYGRSRALQYGSRDDVFFPVTMISKRYEKNIPVDIEELYRKVESEVAKLRRSGRG